MVMDVSTTMSPQQFEAFAQVRGAEMGYDSLRRFLISFAVKTAHGRYMMIVTSAAEAPKNAMKWQADNRAHTLAGVKLLDHIDPSSGSVTKGRFHS